MPVTYAIRPAWNLILFRYHGEVTFHESVAVVEAAASDPMARAGMRHLCDLSDVTGVERDFLALLRMQAQMAESLHRPGPEQVVVFFAPTPAGQQLAEMARRSWEGLDSVIVLLQTCEAEALALLGIKASKISDMLQTVQ